MIKADQSLRDFIFQELDKVLQIEDRNLFKEIIVSFDVEEEVLDEEHYLRTSQIVGCPRKEYYRNKGYEQKTDSQSFINLSAGTFYHHIIQTILEPHLESKEKLITYQLDGVKISGHYDGIINFQNEKRLLEIKTASPFALDKLLKEIAELEKDYKKLNENMVMYKYLLQTNMYAKMLKDTGCQLDGGWLLIVNKASTKKVPPIFTVKFDFDTKLVEKMIKKAKEIWRYFTEDLLPPPTEQEWECRYCGYTNCPFNKSGRN